MKQSGIYIQANLEKPEHFELSGAELCVVSRPGYEGESNQDSAWFAELDEGVVMAVADGAGGVRRGGDASVQAVRALEEALGQRKKRPLRERILSGFEEANRRVMDMSSATTLTVVQCSEGNVRCYNTGDSAALMTGQRGKIKLYTVAHSPTGYALEAGVITEDEALEHDDRHLVSNMLGSDAMRVEMGMPRGVDERDTIVLGTDGLFDNLSSQEIVEIVRTGPITEAAVGLLEAVERRMSGEQEGPSKPDDLTFFVVRLL